MDSRVIKSFDSVIQTLTENYENTNRKTISLQLLIFLKSNLRCVQNECLFQVTNQLLGDGGVFKKLLDDNQIPDEILLNVLYCIEIVLSKKDNYLTHESHKDTVINYLFGYVVNKLLNETNTSTTTTITINKIKLSLLTILIRLLSMMSSSVDQFCGKLFGICKSGMFYPKFQGHELFPTSLSMQETTQFSNKVDKSMKKVYRKKNRSDNNTSFTHTSSTYQIDPFVSSISDNFDSEVSENDTNDVKQVERLLNKIHFVSCKLLGLVIEKSSRKAVCDRWFHLVTDDDQSNSDNFSLISFFNENQHCKRAQFNLLLVLKLLIAESKPILSHAEFRKKSTIAAYTSLVDVLGCTILKLHDFLLDVINNRNHSGQILLQSMKCLECLIQISPYQKMINDHIIVRILRTVRDFIEHSDNEINNAILCINRCIIDAQLNQNQINVIIEHLINADFWILIKCYKMFNYNWSETSKKFYEIPSAHVVPSSLRIETLQLLKSLLSVNEMGFQQKILLHDDVLLTILKKCLHDDIVSVRLHCLRTIESISKHLINEKALHNFWNKLLLEEFLVGFLTNEKLPILITSSCDCFANFNQNVFQTLSKSKQEFLINFLLMSSTNANESVKIAALTALSTFIKNSNVVQNGDKLLVNVYEIANSDLKSESDKVRTQASLMLGFVSDAFVEIKLKRTDWSCDSCMLSNLLKLPQRFTAMKSYKILSNLIRVLSNLLRIIQETDTLIDNTIEFLLNQLKHHQSMKVKWNICYAFSNLFQNFELISLLSNDCKVNIIQELCNILETCDNFKVRINAVSALKSFGDPMLCNRYYFMIWQCLISALTKAKVIDDFKEVEHQKTLIEQISSTMIHLIKLLKDEDFERFNDEILKNNRQLLCDNLTKFYNNDDIELLQNTANFSQIQIDILRNIISEKIVF